MNFWSFFSSNEDSIKDKSSLKTQIANLIPTASEEKQMEMGMKDPAEIAREMSQDILIHNPAIEQNDDGSLEVPTFLREKRPPDAEA